MQSFIISISDKFDKKNDSIIGHLFAFEVT